MSKPHHENEMTFAILRYLRAHPDAKDTLEGIGQWWLLREWSERNLEEVEATLSDLVRKGLVVEAQNESGRSYYGVDRTKVEEIAHILDPSES
jgi:hypothetical protein